MRVHVRAMALYTSFLTVAGVPAIAAPLAIIPDSTTQRGEARSTVDPAVPVPATLAPGVPDGAMSRDRDALGRQVAPLPAPVTTQALLPGHWALDGAQYVWIPPETHLRTVQPAARVPGVYVWRDGAYVWEPTHFTQ